MREYDEFRLVMNPRADGRPPWSIYVDECPPGVPAHVIGPAGDVAPTVTPNDLAMLRDANRWPNSVLLKEIGVRVWGSVMTGQVASAFAQSRAAACARGRSLRVTLVAKGAFDQPSANEIALCELPLEVLYEQGANAYVAVSNDTPVSRRPHARPDASPVAIHLPLRITVAVSTPNGFNFDADAELDVIRQALDPLADRVRIDVCRPATRPRFRQSIESGPHVVHFIGHGDFSLVGDEGTPVGYLGFVTDNGDLDPVDADQFAAFFTQSDVHLVVLTACRSAAAMPEQQPYPITALDGVAQRLVSGIGPVSAVVAMQFDLEQPAAVAFSGEFYKNLLEPTCSLDDAVTLARQGMCQALPQGAAHRAWVTPTLHWRCRGSQVFEFLPPLAPEAQRESTEVDRMIGTYRSFIVGIDDEAPEDWPGYLKFCQKSLPPIEALLERRAELARRAVRAGWVLAKVGTRVEVPLRLHLDTTAPVSQLALTVAFPPERLQFVGVKGLASLADATAEVDAAAGLVSLKLASPAPVAWLVGEAEVARLVFDVASPDGRPSLAEVDLRSVLVTQGGADSPSDDLDGAVLIDPLP